jgi:hypothetical protein
MQKLLTMLSLLALIATSCSTPDSVHSTPIASRGLRVETPLAFDDPKPMFSELFPNETAIKKGRFETQAEFQGRLAATGLIGKEITVLIPPDQCDVFAYPDKGFYVVVCKSTYSDFETGLTRPYGITLFQTDKKMGKYEGQNAFGATANIDVTSVNYYDIGLTKIPNGLRWKDKEQDFEAHFGLPVKTNSEEFRSWLKDNKLSIALKVRLLDLTGVNDNSGGQTATIQSPHDLAVTIHTIPVQLLKAWIVRTDTNTGIIQWDILP